MNKSTIHLGQNSHQFQVVSSQIEGSGDNFNPTLRVPLTFSFNIYEKKNQPNSLQLTILKAELFLVENNLRVSECTQILSNSIYGMNYPFDSHLIFPLNKSIINSIEQYRKGGLKFRISLVIQGNELKKIRYRDEQNQIVESSFCESTISGNGEGNFEIEQSKWVNSILPKIGYDTYKLIELPTTNEVIPIEYKTAFSEFEQANNYFKLGDYDKAVSHCRSALDTFYADKAKFAELKEHIKSKSEFEWANKVLDATSIWLESITKATSVFTSKTHHFPSVGHFSRKEAEIVLLVTTGIIAYVGKIKFNKD